MESKYPQVGDPSHKSSPSPCTHPGQVWQGWGPEGARSSGSSELAENFPGRSAARPGTGARAGAIEAPAPLPPPAAPLPPPAAWTGRRPGTLSPPGEGRGGLGARAHVLLSRSSAPSQQPDPLPSGPGEPPSPPPPHSSPPPPGTMAAPSRHPLPPGSLALSLPDKAGTAAGPDRGCWGAPPAKGGLASRGGTRAQWPWPWVSGRRCGAQPREGWGGNRPPQPSPAQPWPGRWGRSGQEQLPPEASRQAHMACHTLRGHTILDHTCGDADVYVRAHTHIGYTRTRAHPAHTRHRHSQLTRAHTITHVHTYPAPPAQGLTLTVCTHSDAYRQMQGYAYTQLTHAGIGAHPTHTQTYPCTHKSHTAHSYIPRYIVHIHGHTTSFSLQTSLHPCRPCRHTHGPQGPLLSKAHGSCHVAPSMSSQTRLGSCLGNSVLAACALKGTEAMFNAFTCPVYLILSLSFFKLCLCPS